jgi:hypothetical protein
MMNQNITPFYEIISPALSKKEWLATVVYMKERTRQETQL